MSFLALGTQQIEYEFHDGPSADAPTLVFLHEGLGSVALWKDFPRKLAMSAKCNALLYSRIGYGRSSSLVDRRRPQFMHEEALVTLPFILDQLRVYRPILVGHSDGGSIALIHAGSAGLNVTGLILLAPHVMVEPICIESIAAVKRTYEATALREKLRRYHSDPDGAFWGWCDIWLDSAFRQWNIEEHVHKITCPILAIQGEDDEYGTMEQVDRIARLTPCTELLKLTHCGHSPHRDQTQVVIDAAAHFVNKLRFREAKGVGSNDII